MTKAPSALVVIIAVAVVLRVAAALYHGPTIQPLPGVTDQISYHELAIRVAEGHGFSFATGWWPATRANQPTAHWSFLYVLWLAAIYSVVGPVPLVARILQAVIVGVLHPLLTWRLGSRVFGPTVGLTAAAVTAVYGYFVYYAGALVTESLYIVAFLWALDLAVGLAAAVAAGRQPKVAAWALFGVACALGALLRQIFVLMLPAILGWIAWRGLNVRDAAGRLRQLIAPATLKLAAGLAVTVAVIGLSILPWTLRNYRAFGEFVLLNTNAGFVMYWGNHPYHGTDFIPILPSDSTQTNYRTLLPEDTRRMNEAQLDRELLRRGFGFVADTPWRYVQLSMDRAVEYFKFWPAADSSASSNVIRVLSFGLLFPFLFGGVVLALARPQPGDTGGGAMLLVLVAALYSLVHLLTWSLVRYRLPVDAITMPLAAFCLVAVSRRMFSAFSASGLQLRRSTN